MDVESRPEPGKAGLVDALQAPLLLILWIAACGAGVYVGLSLEVEAILALPQYPLVAAILPVVFLIAVVLGIWRLRQFKQWLRPAAVGAVFGAAITGPIFLFGVEALSEH